MRSPGAPIEILLVEDNPGDVRLTLEALRESGIRNHLSVAYAILLLLARLGLRAGEVAALELDDVDWRQGELIIRGKADRRERLPLPVDVRGGAGELPALESAPDRIPSAVVARDHPL
jgi:integrase